MSTTDVKITGSKNFLKKLELIRPDHLSNLMGLMAIEVKEIIKDQTSKGVDVAGKRFKNNQDKTGYSEAYKPIRAAKGLSTTKVDLFFRGEMLSALDFDVFTTPEPKAIVGFNNAQQALKAMGHNEGTKKLPKREFFGISEKRKKKILSNFRKGINTYITKLGL